MPIIFANRTQMSGGDLILETLRMHRARVRIPSKQRTLSLFGCRERLLAPSTAVDTGYGRSVGLEVGTPIIRHHIDLPTLEAKTPADCAKTMSVCSGNVFEPPTGGKSSSYRPAAKTAGQCTSTLLLSQGSIGQYVQGHYFRE